MEKVTFDQAIGLVDNSLRGLKYDPELCKTEVKGRWDVVINKREIWIDVKPAYEGSDIYLLLMFSPLFPDPQIEDTEFYKEMLRFSHAMHRVGVSINNNWALIYHTCRIEYLTQQEVDSIIDNVVFFSEDMYNKMKDRFPDLIT